MNEAKVEAVQALRRIDAIVAWELAIAKNETYVEVVGKLQEMRDMLELKIAQLMQEIEA